MAEPRNQTIDPDEDTLDETLQSKARIEELSSTDEEDKQASPVKSSQSNVVSGIPFPGKDQLPPPPSKPVDLPDWLTPATYALFHPDDGTETTQSQQKTTAECLPHLTLKDTQNLPQNIHGLPHLRRKAHADFLRTSLGPLPAPFAAMDASRPWLFYWTMAGLTSLGEDVSAYKQRLMETVRPLQNPTGGFGGGHGQLSHCACTYATVLALACVDGLDAVDREAMWRWLGQVKQADGGFRMAVDAEEDIRGAYCAMTVITLLNLPLTLPSDSPARTAGLETFVDGLGEWVSRCQTYEGGIAGAPTNEAHGAYAFCALACLSILDAPHRSIPQYLDVPSLIHWLASMQTVPEGGFAGRTNKLVDACYSHWVGGCWALLQAAAAGGAGTPEEDKATSPSTNITVESIEALWNRHALIRYLLTCCQQPGKRGGMRDKPSTRPDGYHTCYSLAGLSAAQNHYRYDATRDSSSSSSSSRKKSSGRLMAAFNWEASPPSAEEMKRAKYEEQDRVAFVHPVFVVPMGVVERTRVKFEEGLKV
ncbi:terpenoid cyclases/Protein prenyltransferase [Hortaea werneckii]|nr:terpenoid cyclases/Protein prenyltransferase [Hortaea werneckii]KAI7300925.1 terpenoid cyclases/Protein prenyltransferase [Hortaea werneckii]